MGILDDFKNDCAENGVDLMAEIEKQNAMMKEYEEHGTINGKQVEIKKSDDYEGIDPECERNVSMDEYPDGELVGEDGPDMLINTIDPMAKFKELYPKVSESELNVTKSLHYYEPVVIQAYCPNCGKPIVSTSPVMFNPYTMEKISKYDCECGWKANLDYSYPRLVMRNIETGEDLEVYTK